MILLVVVGFYAIPGGSKPLPQFFTLGWLQATAERKGSYPPVNQHGSGTSPCFIILIGDASSKACFCPLFMLIFVGVYTNICMYMYKQTYHHHISLYIYIYKPSQPGNNSLKAASRISTGKVPTARKPHLIRGGSGAPSWRSFSILWAR